MEERTMFGIIYFNNKKTLCHNKGANYVCLFRNTETTWKVLLLQHTSHSISIVFWICKRPQTWLNKSMKHIRSSSSATALFTWLLPFYHGTLQWWHRLVSSTRWSMCKFSIRTHHQFKWSSTIQPPRTQRYLDTNATIVCFVSDSSSMRVKDSETVQTTTLCCLFFLNELNFYRRHWDPEQNLAWIRMEENLASGPVCCNVRSCRRPKGNPVSHGSSCQSSYHSTLHVLLSQHRLSPHLHTPPISVLHSWWHHSAVKFPGIQYVHVAEP